MNNIKLLLIILLVVLGDVVCDNDIEDRFLAKFLQHDFKIRNVRTQLKSYDKDHVKIMNITTFKYNRTTAAINGTSNFKTNFGDQLMVRVQGYKFLSNEYRKFPALRFQTNACKAITSNIFGARALFDCGNFTQCFFKKDVTYHICHYVVDETHFPPHIPTGEYMNEIEMIYLNHVIAILNVYYEIYYPIYPRI